MPKKTDYSPLVFFLYHAKIGSHSIQEIWNMLPGILNISLSPEDLENFFDLDFAKRTYIEK